MAIENSKLLTVFSYFKMERKLKAVNFDSIKSNRKATISICRRDYSNLIFSCVISTGEKKMPHIFKNPSAKGFEFLLKNRYILNIKRV